MGKFNIFFQAEGLEGIQHLEIDNEATVAGLKALIVDLHSDLAGAEVFLEDEDEPADPDLRLSKLNVRKGVKVHLHRCRHVAVHVAYNGRTVERRFPPSATIARIKKWAAEKEFRMGEDDAGEHVLQFAGSNDRPNPGVHVGTLAGSGCSVSFDLVAIERVNGAAGPAP